MSCSPCFSLMRAKRGERSASLSVVRRMLSTAKWQKTQGSMSPLALTWKYLRPPAMQPLIRGPSFQKSMKSMGLPAR